MIKLILTFLRLFFGFFIAAFGIVLTINSNLGLSPWDVLHQGISKITPLTIGEASMLTGVLVVITSIFLGVNLGIATILNTFLLGSFMDLIIYSGIIPYSHNLLSGIMMMLGGIILLALGTYFYMSCSLGCAPRDGLMVALTRITKKPVNLIRGSIELTVLILGYLLGGYVGIGTFITAVSVGMCIQIVFKIFKFDVHSVHHKSLKEGFLWIKDCLHTNVSTRQA